MHFENIHCQAEEKNETVQCPDCTKNVRKSGFAKHKSNVHTNANRFVCDICNKGFSTKPNFAAHELVHKGLRQSLQGLWKSIFYK